MRIDALDVYYVAHPLIERTTAWLGPVIYSVMVKADKRRRKSWSESCPFFGADLFAGMRLRAYYWPANFWHRWCWAVLRVGGGINQACVKGNPFAHAAIKPVGPCNQTDNRRHAFGRQR